jgi:hypothetical protein
VEVRDRPESGGVTKTIPGLGPWDPRDLGSAFHTSETAALMRELVGKAHAPPPDEGAPPPPPPF